MAASSYDPQKVALTIGLHLVGGYAEGTFITPTFLSDANILVMGGLGVGTMVHTHNRSAEISFVLQQSSASNDRLTLIFEANSQGLFVPLVLRDGSGTTLLTAATAFIKKLPDASQSTNSVENRTWVVTTDKLLGNIGGNPLAAQAVV